MITKADLDKCIYAITTPYFSINKAYPVQEEFIKCYRELYKRNIKFLLKNIEVKPVNSNT